MISQLTSQTCSDLARALVERGALGQLNQRLTDKRSASRVAEAQQVVAAAEEALLAAVAAERDRGVSWESIGEALGITRSTAHGRFADRLEATESGTDAERFLDRAWQRILNLAEKQLTPLIHGIRELAPEFGQQASRKLLAAATEATFPAEIRVSAMQMLATMEHGLHAEAMESMLQETAARAAMPQTFPAPDEVSQFAEETVSPASLLSLAASHSSTTSRRSAENHAALMSEVIQSFETLLLKRTSADLQSSEMMRIQERIAALLLIRFDELEDPNDLDQAIRHLRSAQSTVSGSGLSESADLLAAALNRRHEQQHDPADLAEAIDLLSGIVSDKTRAYGAEHPETFRARFELAQSLVCSGAARQASELYDELHADQLHVLESDHPDVLQTHGAYAMSLSDLGEHESAERILADLVACQARVLGIDHRDTNVTRANLLTVMIRELAETGDAELIERLSTATWSVLADGLAGNRELRRSAPETSRQLPPKNLG